MFSYKRQVTSSQGMTGADVWLPGRVQISNPRVAMARSALRVHWREKERFSGFLVEGEPLQGWGELLVVTLVPKGGDLGKVEG